MFTQIGEAKELLSLGKGEVTIIGILLVIVAGLAYASVYFVKKYTKSMESRLDDHKEFNKVLSEVNEDNHEIFNKVLVALEVLKNIMNVNR